MSRTYRPDLPFFPGDLAGGGPPEDRGTDCPTLSRAFRSIASATGAFVGPKKSLKAFQYAVWKDLSFFTPSRLARCTPARFPQSACYLAVMCGTFTEIPRFPISTGRSPI